VGGGGDSWLLVKLDGRPLGEAPGSWTVAAGPHDVVVENPSLRFTRKQHITTTAGTASELSFDPRPPGE
jgi:hypothetical protein